MSKGINNAYTHSEHVVGLRGVAFRIAMKISPNEKSVSLKKPRGPAPNMEARIAASVLKDMGFKHDEICSLIGLNIGTYKNWVTQLII